MRYDCVMPLLSPEVISMPDIQQRLNCLLQLAIQQARAADIPVSSRI